MLTPTIGSSSAGAPSDVADLVPVAVPLPGTTQKAIIYAHPQDWWGASILHKDVANSLTDAFVFGSSLEASCGNLAVPYNPAAENAIVPATDPTYYKWFIRTGNGSYLDTKVGDTAKFTIFAVIRLVQNGSNLVGCWGDTYGLSAGQVGTPSATSFGVRAFITQTAATAMTGTISADVGMAKPTLTGTAALGHMQPSLAVTDVSKWRLVALSSDGLTATIHDLTDTGSNSVDITSGYYRFPNESLGYRIGVDHAGTAALSGIDIAMWAHCDEKLSTNDMAIFSTAIKAYYAKRGIII